MFDHWSVWPLLDTGQFGHCLTTGQFDHCLTTGHFSHCLTTGLFREPTHNSHWHRFGHIETWAQRDVGTKRRGHKIPLFWTQRDVGTKYHFFGHIETWAQRDVGTKRRGHKEMLRRVIVGLSGRHIGGHLHAKFVLSV